MEARLDASRRSRFIVYPEEQDSGTMAVLPNVVVAWLWTGLPADASDASLHVKGRPLLVSRAGHV
jgi:hypothetical protein